MYINNMHSAIKITSPFDETQARSFLAGQTVLLSGIIYTARDAAHKRLCGLIRSNMPIPVNLCGQVIYYCGRSPARPVHISGSAGPTTSSRMDLFAPLLMEKAGLRAMIGKGNRNAAVTDAIKKHGCVYFAATGGAGALLAKTIVKSDLVCYEDLGPEAIYRLEVHDMPLIVAIDSAGNSIYPAHAAVKAAG
jgi:fumarate hydratase subunit beta